MPPITGPQFKFVYLLTLFTLLAPCQLSALIQELYQLQRSLDAIKKFISQPLQQPQRKITTYKMLSDALQEAYIKKNPDLLDQFEKNVALTTAQQLLQEFVKEGRLTENEPLQYIPFMAYIVQQITERYPDKNMNLQCVFISTGDLTHEFLLARALRFAGYKAIHIISINSLYDDAIKKALQRNFKMWCQRRNINDVSVDLYQIGYEYMQEQQQKKLAKNHLFLMTKNIYSAMIVQNEQKSAQAVANINTMAEHIIPNYLKFEEKAPKHKVIKIYLPYKRSDFWIDSNIRFIEPAKIKDVKISDMQKFIQTWPDTPLYQKNLAIGLINKFFVFSETNSFDVGYHESLFYFDLIKYTSLNPAKPFAFRIDLGQVNQVIGNMTASLQEILGRSQAQNFREI